MKVYELAFGAVCGLFAGVFVKKSAYMVAFFLLGELFIVLQVGQSPLELRHTN
jgi:FUN14 domain-containing protein 1